MAAQVKTHILTAGVVNISHLTTNITASEALDNYGTWDNWISNIESGVPSEVLLMNPTTGFEEPSAMLLTPDTYAVILLGSLSNETDCLSNECTYWRWGLISYSATSTAMKRIRFVLCEEPTLQPSASASTTAATTTATTIRLTTSTADSTADTTTPLRESTTSATTNIILSTAITTTVPIITTTSDTTPTVTEASSTTASPIITTTTSSTTSKITTPDATGE
ncbi:hypothetical protein SK128_027712 [Halocaridina rubra]|uniref:Uncharacterized protein n=1 Tax=Halocaridina rubra TaxID=373956 RepID=A0AAN8WLX4_HALRR